MKIKTKLDPKKHILVRFPLDSDKYQLELYDFSPTTPELLETLSTNLKAKTANKRGKELAKELNIPYFKSFKSALPEQKQKFSKIKQKIKQKNREIWVELQTKTWENWVKNFTSEQIAIVEAIKIMNQWLKNLGTVSNSFRYDFYHDRIFYCKVYEPGQKLWVDTAYKIKELWIKNNQEYSILGQKVRFEANKKDYLYYHKFEIEGKEYEFHSYVQPNIISPDLAQDYPPFSGKKLSVKEIAEVEKKIGINTPDRFIEMLSWKILKKRFW